MIDAYQLYRKMEAYGPTAKGLLTPDETTHRQRLEAAALLARFCADRWEGGNVLDIGCGFGSMIPLLNQITGSHSYSGVDMTEWILDVARENYGARPNVQLRRQCLDQLNASDASDLVLMLGVLATINDQDIEPALRLAKSLSKKALIVSWTQKDGLYKGRLKAHKIEQLNKFLGPQSLIIGFGPDEPHKIALWLK